MPALFRTLYARLAVGLFLLLLIVGGLFTFLSLYSVRDYTAAVNQELNRDIASNLVLDRNLVTDGQLNQAELKKLFDLYMTIHPGIEIYLLDSDGEILSYSADPARIKRNRVSLEPIGALLENPGAFPVPGDDPRSHDRRKVFSVTTVPLESGATGYLYVVLRGEEYDLVESMVHGNQLLKMGAGALAISLVVGLMAGLVFFHLLTRRLSRLTGRVEAFDLSGETRALAHRPALNAPGDDIDYLAARFEQMAGRIGAQVDLLKEKDHQRRQLVAQVSHDLRTPLASIQGYLEALKMKQAQLSPDEQARFLDVALAETWRLGRLVDELFELAALEAKEKQPSPEPLVLAELLHDVVQKHQPEAERASVRLRIGHVEGVRVMADIAMTERILDNLISNAIVHSPADSEVILEVARDDSVALVSVSDAGTGIDSRDINRLFEPFYQGTGAKSAGHAGLGLAITHRLVTLQGGQIDVSNEGPAGGAQFRVRLPVV
ncbi:ATP-binding protein [Marinobacter sp. chi1]|uniref:histidine kinase n=1 Tax=Marinobacter suaedae TaxID=3057675 RepID=A0ABT8VZX9_9GAMM|nr:ATP-binding protein [Marinobacter sp. chi1]MDO3721550.1 ATP-binding protein [Marinobacter sp. chi1]